MSSETFLGEGISIRPCKGDLGLNVVCYRTGFGKHHFFDLDDKQVKLPADITGFFSVPEQWAVLELVEAPDFIIAAPGDLLAIRRTREPRNGQIALIKLEEKALLRRVFFTGDGLVLRAFDRTPDVLIRPDGLDVRGTVEGIALEGAWYRLITSEKLNR